MKFLFLLALVACVSCNDRVTRITMDIYYGALCPDSTIWFTQVFGPLYRDFRGHLNVTLIPYGKSQSPATPGGPETFSCQQGPLECVGQFVQGCMLRRLPDQQSQVDYILCQMSPGTDISHQTCVERFGFEWSEIQECISSGEEWEQQLDFERRSIPIMEITDWVPSIVYNGVPDENTDARVSAPLRDILCALVENSTPACF